MAPSPSRSDARPSRVLRLGVVLGIAVLLVFTGFVLRLAEDAVRREAEGRVRTSAMLVARLAAARRERLEGLGLAYGSRLRGVRPPRRARLTPADEAVARRTVDDVRRTAGGLRAAILVDPLGRVIVGSPRDATRRGTDLSGLDWYRGATAHHGPYLSRVYRSPLRGHPTVTTFALPIRARGGRTVALLALVGGDRIPGLAADLGRSLDAHITITDQAGTVAGESGRPGSRLVSRRPDPLVRAALDGRAGVEVRHVRGERTVSGYAPVPGAGWAVVADVPASRAFEGVPRLRVALISASAVVAFVLLWLVPLLVARLSRARDALGVSTAFQADLLPRELPPGVRTHYVPSERRMLLGGDFLDAVTTGDGDLAILIGDVCGHGPRAAALGATLRAGWRTLATAGQAVDRLDLLDRLVESQRPEDDLFATVACAVIAADGSRLRMALAGHPPPVLREDGERAGPLDGVRGPALGLGAGGRAAWPVLERALRGPWTLVLYTDGLIEARPDGAGGPRLGLAGLLDLVDASVGDAGVDVDALLRRAAALTGPEGGDDDVALVTVERATS